MHIINKKLAVGLAVMLLGLSMITACVAGPPGPQGPQGERGPSGESGPAGKPAYQPEAAIMLSPSVVELDKAIKPITKAITVTGSGFMPGERVEAAMPNATELRFALGTANDYGAFSASMSVTYMVKWGVTEAGLYTVKAEGDKGSVASSPLTIVIKEE